MHVNAVLYMWEQPPHMTLTLTSFLRFIANCPHVCTQAWPARLRA